jgi:Tfp pilus assembly protein PilW
MLIPSPIRFRWRQNYRGGWTLVEVAVATAVGLIILAAFVAISLSINASMVAVGNYSDLDKDSRQTLDRLSRDIRNAASVSVASRSNLLTLTNTFSGTNLITYQWDGNSNVTRTLTKVIGGATAAGTPEVMLTDCDFLAFHYFIRKPAANLEFISITNCATTNEIKLVSVSWRCSRSVLGSKLNTESVQTANVAVRN